jgi:hypothetical protein
MDVQSCLIFIFIGVILCVYVFQIGIITPSMVSLRLEEFVCIFNGVILCVYVFQIGIIMPSIISLTLEEPIEVTQK